MRLEPGTLLLHGKYRVEEFLGEGGFAQVYRATHLTLGVPRALKVLWRQGPGIGSRDVAECWRRFDLEARLGARLHHPRPHPHLVQVYDREEEGEHLVLVMEYAPGGDLARRLERARHEGKPVPVREALGIAVDVAAGLEALHALDVVHRDVKPSNVLFDGEGRAKLADLGLAQAPGFARSVARSVVVDEPQPGTPEYMSPEQRSSGAYLRKSSDVYTLGAVLFEVLAGRLHFHQPPGTRARTLRAEVPGDLDDLLARMLAEDPRERPFDGQAVGRALAEVREGVERRAREAEQERRRREEQARAERALEAAEVEGGEAALLAFLERHGGAPEALRDRAKRALADLTGASSSGTPSRASSPRRRCGTAWSTTR